MLICVPFFFSPPPPLFHLSHHTLLTITAFRGGNHRIRAPKTTALIFSSGKMVCTGAKTEALAKLRENTPKSSVSLVSQRSSKFKIQNMVGSCDVKFPIRLEGLAWSHGPLPNTSPTFRVSSTMQMPKIVLLIFVSGKIVLTGGKKREDIYQAFENIYPVLTEFRKLANPGEEDPLAQLAAGVGASAAALPAP